MINDYATMRKFMESFDLHTLALGWTTTQANNKQKLKLEKYWVSNIRCYIFDDDLMLGVAYTNIWTKAGLYIPQIGLIPAIVLPNSNDLVFQKLQCYDFFNATDGRQLGDNLYNYDIIIYTEGTSGQIITPPRPLIGSSKDRLWVALFKTMLLTAKIYDNKEIFAYMRYEHIKNFYSNSDSK